VYHKKKPDSVKNLYDPIENSASLLQENATIERLRSVRIVSLLVKTHYLRKLFHDISARVRAGK